MKNRRRLARDVLDTFARHAGRVCDVTGTDKMAVLTVVLSRL